MSTSDGCKDGASKSDGVCDVNNMLNNMRTDDMDNDVSICANCGKEGSDVNNICNKCKKATYCNAACKKKHRHKHKKECEEHVRLAAENAAKLHDETLFEEPPSEFGDCPICFIRLPNLGKGKRYMSCCGKIICSGCDYAPVFDDQGNEVDIDKQNECPFCRVVAPKTDEETNEREKKRIEAKDAEAIYNLGVYYYHGANGYSQDYTKALELWHRAAELGHSTAHGSLGSAYNKGEGVEVDMKKAIHYWELAAMEGNAMARHNLGKNEYHAGNMDRALKHLMIAVRSSGYSRSLEAIKYMYSNGYATKDDYTKALRLYQTYLGEIKSVQRDKAAAVDEKYRYY